ncbi:MAG: hypothetical protein VCB99_03760 [Myxococcota bacterium]
MRLSALCSSGRELFRHGGTDGRPEMPTADYTATSIGQLPGPREALRRNGQLFFPLACWFHFRRRGDELGARVCLLWLAESGMYAAHYMADARAQSLPLVGGHIHDWNWLLSRASLLEHCESLAAVLHGFCSLFAFYRLLGLAQLAFASPESPADSRPLQAMSPRMMRASPPPTGDSA